MATSTEKAQEVAVEAETTLAFTASQNEPMNRSASVEPYSMSWRTLAGFIGLSLSLAGSSFAITGPNASIGFMASEYPTQAHKASWIANTPIICMIALTAMFGATSDRYGKKWFLVGGGLTSLIGSIIGAYAKSINMIIVASLFYGIGGAALNQATPAAMEVVPAKFRTAAVSAISLTNVSLGIVGGTAVFSACVQHGLGWRWGFKIQAIIYGVGLIVTAIFYNPPPTRFRDGRGFMTILRSIDFIGIGLLSVGAVLSALPLTWGGVQYAWNSGHVVPFLIIGPLVLIAFAFYEWKFTKTGVLNHEFFESRSFPIFMFYGFVDGIILYGTSVFIPQESAAVYYSKPLQIVQPLLLFSAAILPGAVITGGMSTLQRKFRPGLLMASGALMLFSGLVSRAKPADKLYFNAMVTVTGFCVGGTEIIPIGAMGLIVPSYLIATSSMVYVTSRSVGGVMGIAIFTAVLSNKEAKYLPEYLVPVLTKAGIPAAEFPAIFGTLAHAPAALAKIPGLTPTIIGEIIEESQKAASKSFKSIWYCIMGFSIALCIVAIFIKEAPHKMNNQVESALEKAPAKESKSIKEESV